MSNPREEAFYLLLPLLQRKGDLSHQLSKKGLSPATKALCFEFCRHYFKLRTLLGALITKKPSKIEIELLLLMGLLQIIYLNEPSYAVVNETVELLTKLKLQWAKGFVNGVLRNYCRTKTTLEPKLNKMEEYLYDHPIWYINQVKQDWPQDFPAILEGNNAHPPFTIRINRQHISRQDYQKQLQQRNIESQAVAFSKDGLTLALPCQPTELPGYDKGFFSVQDEAAQLCVDLLDLHPGLRVLDACCAPGGKTSHMLEREPLLEELLALDIDPKRLERVNENLKRLGLQAHLQTGDAALPNTWWDGKPFDRILLDAPCSATGVIRRHPDIKLMRTEKAITTVVALQQTLLETLWPLLKTGGLMLYATCSVMMAENEEQIQAFLAKQDDCIIIQNGLATGHWTGHGWQILPGEQGMDGFFYSLLQKK